MSTANPEIRVLAVDDEPSLIEDYSLLIARRKPTNRMAALARLEADLFGCRELSSALPEVALATCQQGEEAVSAVLEAVQTGRPFAVAFVDLRMPPGMHGIEVAERMRAIDPHLHIVIVTAFAEMHPVEIARQIPPADRLFFVQKPFHGPEIQQLVNALGARWQAEWLRRTGAARRSEPWGPPSRRDSASDRTP